MPGVTALPPARPSASAPAGRAALPLAVAFFATVAHLGAQTPKTLALPPDSTHWTLEGKAEVTEYLGRRCLMLDGGAATVNDFELERRRDRHGRRHPRRPRVLRTAIPDR